MLIAFDKTYDLENTLLSGQAFRWRAEQDGWLSGVVFDNIVRMRRVADGVEFECGPDAEAALHPLLCDYLRLADDLDRIAAAVNIDERIGASLDRYPGLHILRQEPWECAVSFICSANNNIQRISANVESLAESFGRPLALGDVRRSAFPSPQALADAGEQALRALGLGFRAKYVAAAAERVAAGEIDLYALREASYDEALEALLSLAGVGDKVGNCILLFALDKLEAFPVDVWIDRALRDWYPEVAERKLTRKAMRPWAQAYFGEYAGYANQYLFHNRRLQRKG